MHAPYSVEVPGLVQRAKKFAASRGFDKGCLPEVGRLLQVLAAGARPGTVGEIGTGCGEGA